MRIRLVRKRDGRVVPYDETKIADAIYKAALSVGGDDRFLAEELAEVVTIFLEKIPDLTVPTMEQIQDMVEKVLIETGHARTAKAYILYREKRRKLREAREAREAPRRVTAEDRIDVVDALRERVEPFCAPALVASLEGGVGVPPEVATEVAAAVEARIRRTGSGRVAAETVAALADAELFDRGLLEGRRGLVASGLGGMPGLEGLPGLEGTTGLDLEGVGGVARLGVAPTGVSGAPRERLRALLRPSQVSRGPVAPVAEAAGRLLLRGYALEEIHSPDVAAAHVDGRIHVHGLDAPGGLVGASMDADAIKRSHGRELAAVRDVGPAPAAALARRLARLARAADGRFAVDDANVALAPLVRRADGSPPDDGWVRETAATFLVALAGRVEINLDADVPVHLALRPAVAANGRELDVTYGHLARESRALLLAFLDLWELGTGGPAADVPALTVHVDGLGDDELLDRSCRAALGGRPLTFLRMEDGRATSGSRVLRHRRRTADRGPFGFGSPEPAEPRAPNARRPAGAAEPTIRFAVGKVSINLPALARGVRGASPARLLGEVGDAIGLALAALRQRRAFLRATAEAAGTPLAEAVAAGWLDPDRGTSVIGLAGVNEAVEICLGHELHEEDEALKLGQRIAAFVNLRTEEEARLDGRDVVVEECWEPEVLARLSAIARARADGIPTVTPGARLRATAPIDVIARIEREGRFHPMMRSSAVHALFPSGESIPPASATALLRKALANTEATGLRLGRAGNGVEGLDGE